jgi:hypothetical protein
VVLVGRGVKVWVFVCLCSLLVWLVYLVPSTLGHLVNVVFGLPDFYSGNLGVFVASFVGLLARFSAVILALIVGFLIWGAEVGVSIRVVRLIEAAIFLEGTYFVLVFPSGLWWLGLGFNFLGIAFLLEAVSAGSVLLFLSFKLRDCLRYASALRWVGVGVVGYVGALWFNVVFRWFDMIAVIGNDFLLRGFASWGFLGSMVTMSLAVVFGVIGAYLLAANKGESIWWFGLCLMMIGLHYVIYVAYSLFSGNLDSAMTLDVWTLPFLGLGLSLLRTKVTKALL